MGTGSEAGRPGSWVARLLDFDRAGDAFIGRVPATGDEKRLFGGLMVAQALGAAGATVGEEKVPHSLHAYFLRPGRYGIDVEVSVVRLREGKSFATRRVTLMQRGAAVVEMTVSFHRYEHGPDDQPGMPASIDLHDCVPVAEDLEIGGRLFEIRSARDDPAGWVIPPFWFRSRRDIEDDPLIRACALTYISDLGPVPTAHPPSISLGDRAGAFASLDHSVWFHRPFDPAKWHCYQLTRLNYSGRRGLVRGSVYDASAGP